MDVSVPVYKFSVRVVRSARTFFVCHRDYRGQDYCDDKCRGFASAASHRVASARYERSLGEEGRRDRRVRRAAKGAEAVPLPDAGREEVAPSAERSTPNGTTTLTTSASMPTVDQNQMEYTVVISPTTIRTRVLLSHGPDELLRASMPTPSRLRHERAVTHFLEGLSLWLDAKLRVVLSVGDREAGFCLGLADEMGRGIHSVFYEVEVRDPRAHLRRGRRIRGIGDFADLRQLRMSWLANGE